MIRRRFRRRIFRGTNCRVLIRNFGMIFGMIGRRAEEGFSEGLSEGLSESEELLEVDWKCMEEHLIAGMEWE